MELEMHDGTVLDVDDAAPPEVRQRIVQNWLAKNPATPKHAPTQIDPEKFLGTGHVPAGALDPSMTEQDRLTIAQNLAKDTRIPGSVVSGPSRHPKAITNRDVAQTALFAASLAPLGEGAPLIQGMIQGGLGAAGTSTADNAKDFGKDVLFGGALGLGGGSIAKGLGGLAAGAEPRANRSALRLLTGRDGQSMLDAEAKWGSREAAGQAIRDEGAAKPLLTMRDRAEGLETRGKFATGRMQNAIKEVDDAGAHVDAGSVLDEIKALRDKYFGGVTQGLTDTLDTGRKAANKLIRKLEEQFADKVVGTAKSVEGAAANARTNVTPMVEGVEPQEVITRVQSEAPTASTRSTGRGKPKVVPLTERAPQKRLLTGVAGEKQAAQSEADRAVRTSERADRAALDAQRTADPLEAVDNGQTPGTRIAQTRQAAGEAAQEAEDATASYDRVKNMNDQGIERDPTLRRGRLGQDTTRPQPGSGDYPIIRRQPVSAWEKAKQVIGDEGFLTGAKYLHPDAAAHDPGAKFFREVYGVIRRADEKAMEGLSPELAQRFREAKQASAVAQDFAPMARARDAELFAGGQIRGSSPKSAAFHAATDTVMSHIRPSLISLNERLPGLASAVRAGDPVAVGLANAVRNYKPPKKEDDK